jgi:asparagine synthase (glutamine-hydrolysing)
MRTLCGDNDISLENVLLILHKQYPVFREYECAERRIFIVGRPMYNNRFDEEPLKRALSIFSPRKIARDINGSFLLIIFDKNDRVLYVINDRCASMPFYYRRNKGAFIGATNYSDIWKRSGEQGVLRINEEAFYEFLCFRRLFGSKTYDRDTRYMDSASVLMYNCATGGLTAEKYWRPDCGRKDASAADSSKRLAFLIKEAFSRMTSDGKRYGLLLSGGLDSRAILASSDKKLTCFTTCAYENNEYRVAGELSGMKGYEHIFIPKPGSYYSDIIEEATYLSGAMGGYMHSHFLNIKDAAREKADVLLHGYGFDFLFRGKYLPHTMHPFLKRFTYHRKLRPIAADAGRLADDFIRSVSFRSKDMNAADLLAPGIKKPMEESLRSGIENIINEAKTLSEDPYVWWEYCSLHNISRHYTWPNLLSARSFMEERSVAFDNDLLDLFWSMDPRSRNNGAVFTEAIKILDPKMLSVRIANTNLRGDDHPLVTAGKIGLNKILKDTGLNKIFTGSIPPPSLKERSWPIGADLIRSAGIKDRALKMSGPSNLDGLNFLDKKAVSKCVEEHMAGRSDYTNLILNLITLEGFLGL